MTQWAKHFGTAKWTGANWGEGDYSDGYQASPLKLAISPSDQFLHLAAGFLRADSVLRSVVGEKRIEVVEARPDPDRRMLPRVYLFSGSLPQDHVPTSQDQYTVTLIVGLAFALPKVEAVDDGHPTLASVLHRIEWRIKQHQQMSVSINGSPTILAENLVVQPYNTLDLLDDTGRPWGLAQEIQCDYTVCVQRSSGRIDNIVRAGG